MDRREHAHGMMAGYAQQGTRFFSLPVADRRLTSIFLLSFLSTLTLIRLYARRR